MITVEQKFQDEIEVERLWAATKQGKYVFFNMMPFSVLIVIGLWDRASHAQLLLWFTMLTGINLFRWIVLHFYLTHKQALIDDMRKFKRLIMSGAILNGACWVLCQVLFLVPSDPTNLLIITIPTIVEVVGAMLTWFSYSPAVLAISLPPTIYIICQLLLYGGKSYIVTAIIFSILPILSIISSLKLSAMLDHALYLNFENLALRRESEEKSILLETALENMSQGISMSDKDDRLRMWNRQFTELVNTAGAKVITDANLSAILDAVDPPLQVRSSGATEYRLQNGQVYEIRQSELAQGGRVLTYTDISERIKREQSLDKARKEAEQANAAKTRFLAAASHDLRQPIHALGLFFAELSDRVYSAETASLIGQVEDSISAINSMLNALLDVSKLDAGIVKPTIEQFSLTELFTRLKTEFQPIALECNNQLHIRPTLATVATDPAMLERMLRNLISNALRYTENGRILVAARPRGPHIEIQVIDNGPGIPEDQLEQIFIEFYQLHNPARDRRQGLGLGLAIVKRLSSLLRHRIKVVSRLGKGSCFSITLPLARIPSVSESMQGNEAGHRPAYALTGRQVMVLDDDNAILDGMRGLLTRWGCHVITANSPAQALEKLDKNTHRLELLIVDYRLPDNVSGIEVARNLQQFLNYPIEVLIITGDTGPDRLREADASGYPLLHKPVQPAKLRSTLQYLINKANTVIS